MKFSMIMTGYIGRVTTSIKTTIQKRKIIEKKRYENKFDNVREYEQDNYKSMKIGDKSIIIKRKHNRERSRENEYIGRDNRDSRFNNNNKYKERGRFRDERYEKKYTRQNTYNYHSHSKRENTKYTYNNEKDKPKHKEVNMEVTFQNTEEDLKQKGEEDKKSKRCKNWPNCKNDNCEYHHPKETCQFFPKCQFGNVCLNIHPNIPCKYGFYCTRINCSYSHSSGYNPPVYQNLMPPGGMGYVGDQRFKNLTLDKTKKDANASNQSNNDSHTTVQKIEIKTETLNNTN